MQFFFEFLNIFPTVSGNIGTFRDVLANDFVSILHKTFLPGRVFVAEIYFDIEFFLQAFVVNEKQIVVEGHGFKLGKSPLNPPNRIFHTFNRDRKYFLKERISGFSISADKHISFAFVARNNEVSFGIADSFSVLDVLGSFVDHSLVRDFKFNFSFAPSFVMDFGSLGLDFSTIRAFEILSDRDSGNVWQVPVMLLDAS